MQNPLYNGGPNTGLANDSSSEDEGAGSESGWVTEVVQSAADGDGVGPRNKRTRTFDRFMLSRSPRPLGHQRFAGGQSGGRWFSQRNQQRWDHNQGFLRRPLHAFREGVLLGRP